MNRMLPGLLLLMLTAAACRQEATSSVAVPQPAPKSAATTAPPVSDAARFGLPDDAIHADASTPPPGHPPMNAAARPGAAAPGDDFKLDWTLPAGWSAGPEKPMRLATLLAGDGGKTEISLIALAGTAGDAEANIQRWRQQMGQPPADPAALQKLPSIKILGRDAPLVELEGTFSGMNGQPQAQSGLLGTLCELPGRTLFVKMVGPGDEVLAQRAAFIAFCESLKPAGTAGQ